MRSVVIWSRASWSWAASLLRRASSTRELAGIITLTGPGTSRAQATLWTDSRKPSVAASRSCPGAKVVSMPVSVGRLSSLLAATAARSIRLVRLAVGRSMVTAWSGAGTTTPGMTGNSSASMPFRLAVAVPVLIVKGLGLGVRDQLDGRGAFEVADKLGQQPGGDRDGARHVDDRADPDPVPISRLVALSASVPPWAVSRMLLRTGRVLRLLTALATTARSVLARYSWLTVTFRASFLVVVGWRAVRLVLAVGDGDAVGDQAGRLAVQPAGKVDEGGPGTELVQSPRPVFARRWPGAHGCGACASGR